MQTATGVADGINIDNVRDQRRAMHGPLRALALMILLLQGCGGGVTPPAAAGFVNQTQHTDAGLWALWKAAQQNLSQQIDLNPLQRTLNNVPAHILPGDRRVWNVQPLQLVVAARQDVSSAALLAATGMNRADPTGLIACPQPCNVSYAAAYSLYAPNTSRYAASWEFAGNNFDALVQYEFENHILQGLGYDMTWR
jgi:hypothetical protein